MTFRIGLSLEAGRISSFRNVVVASRETEERLRILLVADNGDTQAAEVLSMARNVTITNVRRRRTLVSFIAWRLVWARANLSREKVMPKGKKSSESSNIQECNQSEKNLQSR